MAERGFDPELFLRFGREVRARRPPSVLLGADLITPRPGHVELPLALREELKALDGFAHGGIVGCRAGNALARGTIVKQGGAPPA